MFVLSLWAKHTLVIPVNKIKQMNNLSWQLHAKHLHERRTCVYKYENYVVYCVLPLFAFFIKCWVYVAV